MKNLVVRSKNRLLSFGSYISKLNKTLKNKFILSRFLKKKSNLTDKSPIVLIWEFGGFPFIFRKNSFFSHALNLRGYKTLFVICDGISFACMQRGLEKNERIEDWNNHCFKCKKSTIDMANKSNVEYVLASKFINKDKIDEFKNLSEKIDIQEIKKFEYLGVGVGELAWSSTNRYFKGFLVSPEDLNIEEDLIYRKYFYASLVNTFISDVVIKKYNPASLLTSHGVYVDYAPPFVIAYRKGIPSLCWSSGFNNYFHYFTIPKGLKKGLRSFSEDLSKDNLTNLQNTRLDNFLKGRYFNKEARDLDIFLEPENINDLKKKMGIENSNPIVALFAHVNWDYCFDLSDMVFKSANDWVVESIKKMINIPDVNWIIRSHPGEKIDGSLFGTDDLIKREFKQLPDHIKILWSDSKINTYGLFQMIDLGLTVFGTVGVELPLFGKPIIASGEAHFSNKGFSLDVKSKDEYFYILENIKSIKPLTLEQINLARKYAYSYFIERQIPLSVINKKEGHWGNIDFKKLNYLLPGNDPIINKICDSIIKGTDVILDEECIKFSEKINQQ